MGVCLGLAVASVAACTSTASGSADPAVTSPPSAPSSGSAPSGHPLRYVALGDSYTIGTSVNEPERWPNQLVRALGSPGGPIELTANLGVNGFTTADVIAVELPPLEALAPDFITLQIGVNDVVQGVPEATYRDRLGRILSALRTRLPADRILLVTTPDYTVTPAGADYGDPATKRAAIRRFNDILTQAGRSLGIAVVDIFDISETVATDSSLVARDGLHPSGRQYALWVGRIAPATRSLIGASTP
jgi:acyl-CoA thioesterase-1